MIVKCLPSCFATCISIGLLTFSFCNMQAQQPDSSYRAVMIIPFDPNMYFSDSDEQLKAYNKKSVKEIRTLFRYGLNINVNAKILSLYETRDLLTDTAKGTLEDLNAIYAGIGYFKDKSMPSTEEKQKLFLKKTDARFAPVEKKKLFTLKKNDAESEAQTASKLKEPDVAHEYMNVRFHDIRLLDYLRSKYGTDLFVFLNQFELVTNFEHCLDRSTNTFERDLKVHFSIFDYTGRQLAGDIAIVHFPSNTNDITIIMRENFPIISEYLAEKFNKGVKPAKQPTSQKIEAEKEANEEWMQFEEGR
ncbi:MAG TPA: hypothetical protein VNJ07_10600 [Chitinophagales bacterium]|nr:hypothetical protein [Chitinophagales bacterium]